MITKTSVDREGKYVIIRVISCNRATSEFFSKEQEAINFFNEIIKQAEMRKKTIVVYEKDCCIEILNFNYFRSKLHKNNSKQISKSVSA